MEKTPEENLKALASAMADLQGKIETDERLRDYERDLISEELNEIRMNVLHNHYDIDTFVRYVDEFRKERGLDPL